MGNVLTREDILGKDLLSRVEVKVPEWGGVVFVREMNGVDREKIEEAIFSEQKVGAELSGLNRARMVAFCATDDQGVRLFSDEDVALLGSKSACALDRVYKAALHINGMAVGEVDKEVENLEQGQSDDSCSA